MTNPRYKGMSDYWVFITLPCSIIGWLTGLIVWSVVTSFSRAKDDVDGV